MYNKEMAMIQMIARVYSVCIIYRTRIYRIRINSSHEFSFIILTVK